MTIPVQARCVQATATWRSIDSPTTSVQRSGKRETVHRATSLIAPDVRTFGVTCGCVDPNIERVLVSRLITHCSSRLCAMI